MPKLIITANPIAQKKFELTNLCTVTGGGEHCLTAKDPQDPYTLSEKQLREAVARFQKVLSDPVSHQAHGPAFLRAAFVDIKHLLEIAALSLDAGACHLKLYNAIDEAGNHFFFMAPITPDGRARADDETTAAMCCCMVPPCPPTNTDRYIS